MKQIYEIAGAILTSLGGGFAILLGLSSWLGNVWANRILEKEKNKLAKEYEIYKSKIDIEVDRISKIQDKALHISKTQYDYEYKVYQEIWKAMKVLVNRATTLYPLNDYQESLKENIESAEKSDKWDIAKDLRADYERATKKVYDEFSNAYEEFNNLIENNSPFYNEMFYCDFCEIRKLSLTIGGLYHFVEIEAFNNQQIQSEYENEGKMTPVLARSIEENEKEISRKVNETMRKIRGYLLELQIKE